MKTNKLLMVFLLASASSLTGAVVTWTGPAAGNWSDGSNWSGGSAPGATDTVNIGSGVAVTYDGGGNLPGNITLNLDGTLTNSGQGALRTAGATIAVGASGEIAGDFWDLANATITFADGAAYSANDWENKDTNSFTFELGASGFTTLTPNRFFIGNGALPGDIANASYYVDLANYTGGTGIITLVDYGQDVAGMDNATFQGANELGILNAGGYAANLQWNDTNESIELNITSIPEPSSLWLLGLGMVAFLRRSRG